MKQVMVGVLLSLFTSIAVAHTVLRIGVSESDSPPLAFIADKRLVGGILKDMGEILASELGAQPEFVVIPRKRIELFFASGKVQIICNANSMWQANADKFNWTKEIYSQVERVVSLNSLPPISNVNDLIGKKISTIRGFNYSLLDPIWAKHAASREDEPKLDLMLRALQKKLSDVAIVSEMEFAYWVKRHPQQALVFKQHPLILSSMPTMCAVDKKSSVTVEQLNQVIDRLQRSDELKHLINKYLK